MAKAHGPRGTTNWHITFHFPLPHISKTNSHPTVWPTLKIVLCLSVTLTLQLFFPFLRPKLILHLRPIRKSRFLVHFPTPTFFFFLFFFSGILCENQFGNIDFDMSRRKKVNAPRNLSLPLFLVVLVLISFSRRVACVQDKVGDEDNGGYDNPAAQQLFTQLFFKRISNFTSIFKEDITKNFGFCITDVLVSFHFILSQSVYLDPFVIFIIIFFFLADIVILRRFYFYFYRDADWNGAFNFSKHTGFISACAKKTKGNIALNTYDSCYQQTIVSFFCRNSFFLLVLMFCQHMQQFTCLTWKEREPFGTSWRHLFYKICTFVVWWNRLHSILRKCKLQIW